MKMEEEQYGEDLFGSDEQYDRIRDDNSMELLESVEKLIARLSKLMYYEHRNEGLAKDLIDVILRELKFKIRSVENITPTFQDIRLEAIEEIKEDFVRN